MVRWETSIILQISWRGADWYVVELRVGLRCKPLPVEFVEEEEFNATIEIEFITILDKNNIWKINKEIYIEIILNNKIVVQVYQMIHKT